MVSSAEERNEESSINIRIAAGIILGMVCFAAVLTGGVFVGRTMGAMLSTLEMIAPSEIDPLR